LGWFTEVGGLKITHAVEKRDVYYSMEKLTYLEEAVMVIPAFSGWI
jgi:hypothetical protein